jgi:hypothetical protein
MLLSQALLWRASAVALGLQELRRRSVAQGQGLSTACGEGGAAPPAARMRVAPGQATQTTNAVRWQGVGPESLAQRTRPRTAWLQPHPASNPTRPALRVRWWCSQAALHAVPPPGWATQCHLVLVQVLPGSEQRAGLHRLRRGPC